VVKGAKQILAKIRDLIFPVFCISCGLEGKIICSKCLKKITAQPQIFYPAGFLDGAVALGNYQEKILQTAITEYKYNFNQEIFVIFQKIIADWQLEGSGFGQGFKNQSWLIIPVPLHKDRFWERGFNQAEELAKLVTAKLGLKINIQLLKRIKKTKRQVGLGRSERQENLKGAFEVVGWLRGANVILIDDVFTTGATLQECAKVLKQAGASGVWAITVARES